MSFNWQSAQAQISGIYGYLGQTITVGAETLRARIRKPNTADLLQVGPTENNTIEVDITRADRATRLPHGTQIVAEGRTYTIEGEPIAEDQILRTYTAILS